MKVSSSKENILKKIRQALSHPVPVPFPKSEGNNSVFQPQTDDLEVQFAEEFTRLLGKFAFCVNEADLSKQLHQLFAEKSGRIFIATRKNYFLSSLIRSFIKLINLHWLIVMLPLLLVNF